MSSAFAALSAKRNANGRNVNALPSEQDAPIEKEDQVNENGSRSSKRRKRARHQSLDVRPTEKASSISPAPQAVDDQGTQALAPSIGEDAATSSLSGLDILDDDSDQDATTPTALTNRQLSTFRATPKNVLKDTDQEWVVSMGARDKTLSLVGQYDLWVRKGAVSLIGAVLHASSRLYRVYAPATHAVPVIRPIRDSFGLNNAEVEICFRSCSSGIRSLRLLSPRFARLWNGHTTTTGLRHECRRSFAQLRESAYDPYERPLSPIEAPPTWQDQMRKCCDMFTESKLQKVLICGPKGTGKSTFCRMLSNALLSISERSPARPRVFLLDADPGQPEFAPPGDVSLMQLRKPNFGAPFTHPGCAPSDDFILYRAHHIGALTPKEDPKHYFDCLVNLLETFEARGGPRAQDVLLINSAGWIQGLGLNLLEQTILVSKPTQVVFTSITGPEESIEAVEDACKKAGSTFQAIASQPYVGISRTASELREMQTTSYFHLSQMKDTESRWSPDPLSSVPPILVPYAGRSQAILGVMTTGIRPNMELLPEILAGSVVAIVYLETNVGTTAMQLPRDLSTDENLGGDAMDSAPDKPIEPEDSNQPIDDLNNAPNVSLGSSNQLSILRSSHNIPCLVSADYTSTPLPPSRSHCIGQALIRSIDTVNQTFHLLTPVPITELQRLHASSTASIVLVRGKIDIPTWAYKEDIEYEKAMAVQGARSTKDEDGELSVGVGGEKEKSKGGAIVSDMVATQPWLDIVKPGQGGGSGKKRKVRRDLKYKPTTA